MKHRAGKKERSKRERRGARQLLNENMNIGITDQTDILAFELRNAGSKGLGLFATRDIAPGERIVEESPLFVLPKEDTLNASIIESFLSLRPEQQAAYLDLSFHTTCGAEQVCNTDKTSDAEDGVTSSTSVEDPETSAERDENATEQDDRRSCASDMQPLPPKALDRISDFGNTCKLPNADASHDDHSLKGPCKLDMPEYEATTSTALVQQSRVDSPVRPLDECARPRDFSDLEHTLEAIGTATGSDAGRDEVNSSNDAQDDQHKTERDMTESLAAQIINIWRTNSYMLDDGISLDYAGVGLIASRLNHSCVANVYTAYNSTTGFITVQAIKPIAAGDELCTAYINGVDKLRSERRAQLHMWGFECSCVACADGHDESRRREIKSLKAKVEETRTKMNEGPAGLSVAQIEQTVVDLLELATLMSDEGLLGPDLADICFGAARCCLLIDHHAEAGALQSSGFQILLRSYGIDSPICIAALQAGDLSEV